MSLQWATPKLADLPDRFSVDVLSDFDPRLSRSGRSINNFPDLTRTPICSLECILCLGLSGLWRSVWIAFRGLRKASTLAIESVPVGAVNGERCERRDRPAGSWPQFRSGGLRVSTARRVTESAQSGQRGLAVAVFNRPVQAPTQARPPLPWPACELWYSIIELSVPA
jgi:hypothetical protein